MPIFRLTETDLVPLERATFQDIGIRERIDLQRLLRNRIDVIAPDTLIIAEEFGDWLDSRRRIDLLGVDRDGNLVVFELKRTEDGGHMDLQAIRYAAMVSTLTFEQATRAYGQYLQAIGREEEDPREILLEWLDWETPDESRFAQDVRVVLASAEFGIEITTAALWLNSRGIDIRCVRLEPYAHDGRVLVDVQQVVPLPEATEYQVRVRQKEEQERRERTGGADFTRYDLSIGDDKFPYQWKRRMVYKVVAYLIGKGISPDRIKSVIDWLPTNLFRHVDGGVSAAER
jgi:hypothetical protein